MRRMITEKDADKLRFIDSGEVGDPVTLINDDAAQITLDSDDIEVRGIVVEFIDAASTRSYLTATSDGINVKTDFRVFYQNSLLFEVRASDNRIHMELPIQDPHDKGCLWNDNGIVKISLG